MRGSPSWKPAAGERAEAPALVIEAQIDEMAGDKAAAEAKYRRAMTLDKNGLRATVAVAEGLMRLGKTAEARDLLKTYGEKYSDAVVMDGLIAPNAPMPQQRTPASRHPARSCSISAASCLPTRAMRAPTWR